MPTASGAVRQRPRSSRGDLRLPALEWVVSDGIDRARMAAIWMVQGAVLARLLRAHGQEAHAGNLEAALNEVARIISGEVDRESLAQAMSFVTDQMWGCESPESGGRRH